MSMKKHMENDEKWTHTKKKSCVFKQTQIFHAYQKNISLWIA